MDDILVVDEDLVDINCDGNRQSDNKKGKHSSGGRMAKGEKKSKKKLAIIISSVAAVAVALGVAGFCIFGGNLFNSVEEAIAGEFKFPDGTTVSGVSISGKTYDEAKKALEEKEASFIKPLDISVDVNGVISKVTEKDFKYTYDIESVLNEIKNEATDPSVETSTSKKSYTITATVIAESVDEAAKKVAKKNYKEAENARVSKFHPYAKKRFEYTEASQGQKVNETDLAPSDYTLNVTSEVDGKATTFNVALTNTYLQKNDFYAEGVTYTSVTYSAKLNKYAVTGKTGNPNTETKLVYSNKNGVESEVNGNTVYVYSFAVTTNKTDPAGKALEGAEFSLFKTEEDATALTNAIASGVSDKTGKVTYYNTSKEEIKLASGKYYIVETKAPTGYNIYGKVIPVTIDVTYGATFVDGSYITNCPTDGTASVDVKDTKVVVPQTGGVGTVMFYILGTAFALGGIATLLIRRRVKATNK